MCRMRMRLWKVQMIIGVHWPKHLLIHYNFHFRFVPFICPHANYPFPALFQILKAEKSIRIESKCSFVHSVSFSLLNGTSFHFFASGVYARIYLCMCVLCCALNVKWWCSKFPTLRGTIELGLEIHGNGSFYKGSSSTTSIDTAYVGTNINIRICMPYNVAVYGLQAALL